MKIFVILLSLFSFNAYAVPVDINKADAETIAQSLNGIGIKKATAIVQYRKQNGSFKALKDLMNVKGIGEKTISKNKADIKLSKVRGSKKVRDVKNVEKKAKKAKAVKKLEKGTKKVKKLKNKKEVKKVKKAKKVKKEKKKSK